MSSSVSAGLQAAIKGHVFSPGDPGFGEAARVFNTRFDDVTPTAVARPVNGPDVRDGIRFTTEHGVSVRARSGGHSYAGYSTLAGGVVLDLRKLDWINVDTNAGTATIGAGVQLIDVYAGLAQHGLTLPGGSCPSVGIAGVTLGGGFGLASRYFGLTIDSLLAVEIVTADGQLRTVDHTSDGDLLWALKGGGGGNFGIVTEFVFKAHPMPSRSTVFEISWPWTSADQAIAAWQGWAPHATDKVTSVLHLDSPGHISTEGQYLGALGDIPSLVKTLMDVPGASMIDAVEKPYLQTQLRLAGCSQLTVEQCHTTGAGPGGVKLREAFNAKSDYVLTPLSKQGRAALIAAAEAPGSGALLCDSYGGAVGRVEPSATAFVHRRPLFCIQYYGDGDGTAWIDQAWRKMRSHVSGGAYQNYMDASLNGWEQAYYGQNLNRLQATRRRIDPHHYFNFPQAIGR
jgi:FAD/FMN-containing dehydrogenase